MGHDRAGSCCFPFSQYTTNTQKMLFPFSWCILTLVYPVQPDLCMRLYWTGGWARTKNQTCMGGARTPLPSSKTEQKWVGRKNQKWQTAQCFCCPIDCRDWSWHCQPYSLMREEQLKAWCRPSRGAALVSKCPKEASSALASCLVPVTLRRPGPHPSCQGWLLGRRERETNWASRIVQQNSLLRKRM